MPEPQNFSERVEKLLDDFNLYDKTVDLVSCWEFFYTKIDSVRDRILYFDRFPRLTASQETKRDRKTPDFAVLVSASYGLVGEIKHGFPLDDATFLQHLGKLKKYDQPLSFRADDKGKEISPVTHDILLIVRLRDAQETVVRIEKLLREGNPTFERRLIVFEWVYDDDEYIFRRVAGQSADFNDSTVPQEVRLSKYFGERGASLKVTPDKIKLIKAAWQFCNDEPKPIYTIVFLWTKILYHLLGQDQREIWRRKNAEKGLAIDLTVDRLVAEISARYPINWGHWTDWVRKALDVLVTAGLARKIPGSPRYVVGYRNLTKEVGQPGHPALGSRGTYHPAEYAKILATYICRGLREKKAKTEAQDDTQAQHKLSFPEPTNSPNSTAND